ncbi:MAG TPA: amidoligase family protein, partial [Tepidisphaeraceae bacterium]|nr:amidoligase family protein [Tepidisphaeraceae bacterium]
EIDMGVLKEKRYENALRLIGVDPDKHDLKWLENALLGAGGTVAPIEVGTPPLPIDDLAPADELRRRLRDAGGKGTRVVPWYAFGMHINPELPSRDAAVLRDYLRAFVLLYPWLKQRAEVTFTRSVAPFINPFPDAYVDLILHPSYAPDQPTLIDDYLAHNATRNRPLDMLPILMELDAERVRTKVPDLSLVRPRPAFHYRLPNSMLDEDDWTLAREWNAWVAVERLAGDPALLAEMAGEYAEAQRRSFKPFYDRWPGVLEAHARDLSPERAVD